GGGPLQLADHVHHAVLQNLELADRHAELLAGLQVVQGQVAGHAHGPDGFAAQGGDGTPALVADGVVGVAGAAQQFTLDVVQEQLATLAAIHGGVHAAADTLSVRVDDEQADTLLVTHVTGGAGGNQDLAGGVAADHHGLATAQAPAAAVLAGSGLHVE